MPLLFSIGMQGALEEVADTLGEQLCAFLDDISVLCQPHRVKTIYDVFGVAGIRLHQGKTRVWNKAGVLLDDVHTLGYKAWQLDGVVVLGTHKFVAEKLRARVVEERRLWEATPTVPDL